jgi:hypothetical protein
METQLEKSNPKQLAFVETSMQNFDTALEFCNHMVRSKILPKHYYDKNGGIKDESGGMLLMVLQMGKEIGMSQMMAIQQIVPVNGLMSIKGDGAKALIMASGKCAEWKEWMAGESDNLTAFVSAKRKDTGEELTRSFAVIDAKRAGLYIDAEIVKRNDSLKYSPWFKYGNRMLRYRALGFLCRDLFGDVLQGISIEEEARDIDVDISKSQSETGVRVDVTAGEKNESLEKAATKATRSRAVTSEQPAAKKESVEAKAEEIQDAVVIDSKQPAPQEQPIEETTEVEDELMQKPCAYLPSAKVKDLITTNKEDCKAWINAMLLRRGVKSFEYLFTQLGVKMSIGAAHDLIMALRENRLEAYIQGYQTTLEAIVASQTPPPAEEPIKEEKPVATGIDKAKIDIPELMMGSRDFNQQFQLMNDLKRIGIGTNQIDKFIADAGLSVSQNELIASGSVELIKSLINNN